ncbi:hypothetical protein BC835DRAFT_603611 [Cytidiella melzeri]|nr:hypothetical protein BC835DRAFT_603611 [Cytidiella melzeri]
MQLSTSFILVVVMFTSAFHMATVSALPHSSTEVCHHSILSSSHHSLVRRMKNGEEYWAGLAHLDGLDEAEVLDAYKKVGLARMGRSMYNVLKLKIRLFPGSVRPEIIAATKVWDKALAVEEKARRRNYKFVTGDHGRSYWIGRE